MQVINGIPLHKKWAFSTIALFHLGFRPFFLFGAAFGVCLLMHFILLLSGKLEYLPSAWDIFSWHRHEMLFGFTGAIIAGFLFTAVPNWTGQKTPQGPLLAAIVALWMAGRLVVFYSAYLPAGFVAVVDVAFFVACAASIAPALLKAKNKRNYMFIGLLLLLATANALTHSAYTDAGIRLALAIITVMLVIIGGRVIPFFTERKLGISISRNPLVERLTIATTLAALILDVTAMDAFWAGTAFLAAAVANGFRWSQWQWAKTLHVPLLWVLHAGYLWLVISFTLKAASLWGYDVPATIALHALTAGAISGLILGMITRVSLGHSGRPLEIRPVMTGAFLCINLATILRVFGVWLLPAYTMEMLQFAAALWLLSFGAFVLFYAPILMRPRATA